MRHVVGRVFAAVPVLPYAPSVAYSPAHSIVGPLVSQRVLSGPITWGSSVK
jgi:hypothetical protein